MSQELSITVVPIPNWFEFIIFVRNYSHYLLQDILIARPADQGEGEDEHISPSVAERPQSAVILLTCIQGGGKSIISSRKKRWKHLGGIAESSRICCNLICATPPAVSQRPKLTMLPSTETLALKLSNTVGI